METNIRHLIDFEKVDTLLEGFNKSNGFLTAILDLRDNVLSKSGWRQICTEFHRINPETSKKCTISDMTFQKAKQIELNIQIIETKEKAKAMNSFKTPTININHLKGKLV